MVDNDVTQINEVLKPVPEITTLEEEYIQNLIAVIDPQI